MSVPVLYGHEVSPPVRAVLLVTAALDIKLDFKEINLVNKDHLTTEYIKMNPQHTVPTLNDNGFIIWDSNAIAAYIVNQYGPDECSLYPTDPKKRAVVDQRLHFNSGILFPRLSSMLTPVFLKNEPIVPQSRIKSCLDAYEFLEVFLNDRPWLAGEEVTIADLCCVSTVCSMSLVVPASSDKYPNILKWIDRCSFLPYYEESQKGLVAYKDLLDSKVILEKYD